LASPRSVKIEAGINSAARASASSGVCLNLKVSSTPGAAGAALLAGLAAPGWLGFLAAVELPGGPDETPLAVGGFFALKLY
jgi:hypothetical protein